MRFFERQIPSVHINSKFTRFAISRNAGVLLALACSICVSGCAAIPLAAIGTALGAVTSAASGGSEVYSLGKLDDVFATDLDSCHVATVAAATDLWLHLTIDHQKDPKKKDIWFFRFTDDQGSKVDVTIEQRAHHLCRVRVDVGWFGSEPTAKLFMDRIRLHLPVGVGTAQATRAA